MSSKYTQQHYEDMARILREERTEVDSAFGGMIIDSIESRMVALFEADNARFSQDRFSKAARPEPGTDPSALEFGDEPKPFSSKFDQLYGEYLAARAPGSWDKWLKARNWK